MRPSAWQIYLLYLAYPHILPVVDATGDGVCLNNQGTPAKKIRQDLGYSDKGPEVTGSLAGVHFAYVYGCQRLSIFTALSDATYIRWLDCLSIFRYSTSFNFQLVYFQLCQLSYVGYVVD